jgi:hypothetical protein
VESNGTRVVERKISQKGAPAKAIDYLIHRQFNEHFLPDSHGKSGPGEDGEIWKAYG